ncbi:hypothetical protein D8M04_04690 [Oceanobacillus piezotolerans]|uniref:Uncharacterized protein n=1 Tax=Oceanobacillus piezotolerans TaxID=2448030 RepID=A0A498DPD9_9BACI|nr:hypothetical protein [Oceanobacillus piezotolerans]RLL46509.1 hypothetical protein D8M04_04690 [Oceanobacillus piezotolerans]
MKELNKWNAKLNRTVNNEEGSQAVEFMGIAAVVIMLVIILTTWMGNQGDTGFTGILDGIISLVSGWF